jgi:hypothetical protein
MANESKSNHDESLSNHYHGIFHSLNADKDFGVLIEKLAEKGHDGSFQKVFGKIGCPDTTKM